MRAFVCTSRWCCCESNSDLCSVSSPLHWARVSVQTAPCIEVFTERLAWEFVLVPLLCQMGFVVSVRINQRDEPEFLIPVCWKTARDVPDWLMMMMIVPCQKQKGKKWQKAKAIKTNLVSTESSLYKLNYIHVCLFWVCGHVKIYLCSRGFPVCAVHVSFTVISPFILLLSSAVLAGFTSCLGVLHLSVRPV